MNPDQIIIRPHVTEKSANGESAARPVYTFVVAPRATKHSVAKAINSLFQVKPLKVNLTVVKGKNFLYRGRPGRTTNFKKARVYLPAGTKLKLI